MTQEVVDCFVGQVGQQPFGEPRRRRRRVEARLSECRRPVRAQVGCHRPPVTARRGALVGEYRVLEGEDHRRVDLVHRRTGHPVKPERPRVEPGGEDHRLQQPGSDRGAEEVVEEPRPHRHVMRQAEPRKIRVCGGLFRGDGYPPGQLTGGGLDERRGIRIADQRFGVMALHGAHGRGTQGGDADPANDVPTTRLRVHNDHYATKSATRIA